MDTTDSGSSGSIVGSNKMLIDEDDSNNSTEVQGFTENASLVGASISSSGCNSRTDFRMRRISRNIFGPSTSGDGSNFRTHSQQRERCQSPVSSMVSTAMNQLNLKRSSSAPMINQLGISPPSETPRERLSLNLTKNSMSTSGNGVPGPSSSCSTPTNYASYGSTSTTREVSMDVDGTALVSSFLASLNNPRPRRFSASFSPGSPGPAPNRVSQLRRQENTSDWETNSEKEFHGAQNMAQSWEDLSLASMSMDLPMRRPSFTDPLFVSMSSQGNSSASSSPAASPRICNRFSPGLSSPSPTRKGFTSRRSLSPIATMRPSVLSVGLSSQQQVSSGSGLKRKSCWDSGKEDQMDCTPQPPAKRFVGLLTPGSPLLTNHHNSGSPTYPNHHFHQLHQNHLILQNNSSPNSLDTTGTESSVSSISGGIGDGDSPSPFFRPLDSPSDISSSGSPLTK